jgi:hypothetical protein
MGLMLGYQPLTAQFPGVSFSDRFWILRTRDALPDYLPADAQAEDTFTLMAQRCLGIVDRAVAQSGGLVSTTGGGGGGRGELLLPPVRAFAIDPMGKPNLSAAYNPLVREMGRSNYWALTITGGTATGAATLLPAATYGPPEVFPWYYGFPGANLGCNGAESDARGVEPGDVSRVFFSTQTPTVAPSMITYTVTYSRPVSVAAVRFIEGGSCPAVGNGSDPNVAGGGGWFESLSVELLIGGIWTPLAAGTVQSEPLDPARPMQSIEWALPATAIATGVRIVGVPGGSPPSGPFVTISELDTLAPPSARAELGFDLNGDGTVSAEDLYAFAEAPTDLNGDGAADSADWSYLVLAVRWNERAAMTAGR